MSKKLNIAVLSNGHEMPNWQHVTLEEISNSSFAELTLNIIIKHHSATETKQPFFWRWFSTLDTIIFKPEPSATVLKNTSAFFKNTLNYLNLNEIDYKLLEKARIDVLLNFTNTMPTQEMLSICKFGVWDLMHSNTKNKNLPGAWELFEDLPEIEGSLRCMLLEAPNPLILDQTYSCTDWISCSRNANSIYWQTYPLINRNLKKLHEQGRIDHKAIPIIKRTSNSFSKYPHLFLILWHITKTILKKLTLLIEKKFLFNQWILLFHYNKGNEDPFDIAKYIRILPPKDRFWADPFLIKKNGRYFLFVEELIYKNKLGHLAVMEIDEDGNFTAPITILKKDYHLSYPFLIEDNGNLYMIPETSANRDIQLYKCIKFPYEWKLEKTLMQDVVAVDSTVLKKDGLYWMFTNIRVHTGGSDHTELFLFSSDNLISNKWKPHPMNPIVSDIKKARPAGNIYIKGNDLIRPSQNCSHYYGYGMNINKINKIDDSNFEEEILLSIQPKWRKDVLCTHTFNFYDKIYISDAKIKRSRFF